MRGAAGLIWPGWFNLAVLLHEQSRPHTTASPEYFTYLAGYCGDQEWRPPPISMVLRLLCICSIGAGCTVFGGDFLAPCVLLYILVHRSRLSAIGNCRIT